MNINYFFPAELIKSSEDENRIKISIVPNSPNPDRVNDKILIKAFNEQCINDYLTTSRVIDYDHKSILGATDLEKSEAIIGEAENFYINTEKNVPICEGFLFKSNPIVKRAIQPALESGSKVYGASVGGKILQKSAEIDPETKKKLNVISKISLNHIALCPLNKAVNIETTVQLRKSFDGNQEAEINFDTYDNFIKSFEDEEILQKALQAGSITDIANISGGQALQMQSLEGANDKIKGALPFVLENFFKGEIKGKYDDWKNYLMKRGFTKSDADKTIKLFAKNGASILKLTF